MSSEHFVCQALCQQLSSQHNVTRSTVDSAHFVYIVIVSVATDKVPYRCTVAVGVHEDGDDAYKI